MNHPKLERNGSGIVLSFPRDTWLEKLSSRKAGVSQGMSVVLWLHGGITWEVVLLPWHHPYSFQMTQF